jgi:hypothetical protein
MEVRIGFQIAARHNGVRAIDTSGHFVGHGEDEDEAIMSLERAARAWCRSLARLGALPSALGRMGLHAEGSEGSVEVVLHQGFARAEARSALDRAVESKP